MNLARISRLSHSAELTAHFGRTSGALRAHFGRIYELARAALGACTSGARSLHERRAEGGQVVAGPWPAGEIAAGISGKVGERPCRGRMGGCICGRCRPPAKAGAGAGRPTPGIFGGSAASF